MVTKHEGIGAASVVILVAGALMSVPTVLSGLWIAAEHETHHTNTLDTHRLLGIATMVVGLFGVFVHSMRRKFANADLARNFLFVAAAVLAGSSGFVGGEMTHGQEHANAATGHDSGDDHHGGDSHGSAHGDSSDVGHEAVGAADSSTAVGGGQDDTARPSADGGKQQPTEKRKVPAKNEGHDHSTHDH